MKSVIIIAIAFVLFIPLPAFTYSQNTQNETIEVSNDSISWDKDFYMQEETAIFTLVSDKANKNSNSIDFAIVKISSDSDKIGLGKVAIETGLNTGIFVGDTQIGSSVHNYKLVKTNVGDLVYVKFDSLSDSSEIIVNVPTSIPIPSGVDTVIPDWVQNIFIWYDQDQITEDELLTAIKYLTNEKILVMTPQEIEELTNLSQDYLRYFDLF